MKITVQTEHVHLDRGTGFRDLRMAARATAEMGGMRYEFRTGYDGQFSNDLDAAQEAVRGLITFMHWNARVESTKAAPDSE